MHIQWLAVREERDVEFGSLKPGDRFVRRDSYFTLRQVVRKGVYLESIVVGRFAQDRVSIELAESEPESTSHNAEEVVHRIVCDLEPLCKDLQSVRTIEELDKQLADFGGGAAPDDFFDVFLQEYDRRGCPMPQ